MSAPAEAFVAPALRPTFYAYVVVDSAAPEFTPIAVLLTRAEARSWIDAAKAAGVATQTYRIRRTRCTVFER